MNVENVEVYSANAVVASEDLYQRLLTTMRKHLLMDDTDIVDVIVAVYIAHHFASDPLWLMVIAAASSGKTELLMPFVGLEDVYILSSLTENTFISGWEKGEQSLLHGLKGKVLIMKEFTTVLEMKSEKRAEVLSQLREIYDGRYSKAFGTGLAVDWAGKVGIIAAVTPVIDQRSSIFNILGERFIQIRLTPVDSMEVAEKAMDAVGGEKQARGELSSMMAVFCKSILSKGAIPPNVPEAIQTQIAGLASLCVKARSGVSRDPRSREIAYIPAPEGPARLAKQLLLLAQGLAAVRGRGAVNDDDFFTVNRVAFDCMPSERAAIIQLFFSRPSLKEADVLAALGEGARSVIRRALEDMVILGILDKDEDLYSFSEETCDFFHHLVPQTPPPRGKHKNFMMF